ncbi:MAG: prepilin-type N-terminal cleavage/methylation domain-containing protein [Planctomycetes bacterium]|nr:prepilin-type N-terminal cleavage/methylation domain-containing protein [Planctomycetota bacterium]
MTSTDLNRRRVAERGFTLMELLIVIAIIALLGGLGISRIMSAKREAIVDQTRAFILNLGAAADAYQLDRKNGVYPPTTLEGFPNLGSKQPNRTNLGIEALVTCLCAPGTQNQGAFEQIEANLINTDEDQSTRPMTVFKNRDLFEVADPWGNPYAYFNAADYDDQKLRFYLAAEEGSGSFEDVTVVPWKNPKTGSYYNLNTFQLFSAGPDGIFNTEDDIGNWTAR